MQRVQIGLMEPVELRRVNTGTGTEGSRVSTVGEVGESHAVRARYVSVNLLLAPASNVNTLLAPLL